MARRSAARLLPALVVSLTVVLLAPPAAAQVPDYDFASPLFGLAVRGDVLLVADSGAGVVRLGADSVRLAVELPGVTDVAPLKKGRMWAVTSILTGIKGNRDLYMVKDGHARLVADLGEFEKQVNPDGARSTPIRSTWTSWAVDRCSSPTPPPTPC